MTLVDHIPQGNPCSICGKNAYRHRVEHEPLGDPCAKCHLPASRHRTRKKNDSESKESLYIGIDGEGQGRAPHRYVLLGASTEDGLRQWYVENHSGLSTVECLDFLLNIPQANAKCFTFAFNYDLTKILTDLPNHLLYKLFRPEIRQRIGKAASMGPIPIRWNGYVINLQGTKFSIAKGDRHKIIWDVFKFFQSKFVTAIKDWKVGHKELWERMQVMKDQRSEFDKVEPEEVRSYCLEECQCMAQLAHKLVSAHDAVGLKLKSFFGAGSSGSAILTKMGIKDKIKLPPKDMWPAVASGFFGGRFENSVIGTIRGTVYNYDISSAYPYQLTFLPCLIHGRWELTKDRAAIEMARTALVKYRLHRSPITTWAPFPFRERNGSICFPANSMGGWVWRDEFIAGERIFDNVEFLEAWTYHCDCTCQPFADIPTYYNERCRIGKEGPGIVLKLGCNSAYGKLAQSLGFGQFNSWVWAGMITSGCRAQILEVLELHDDWSNLLMVATDGIYTRERIKTPVPKPTGTDATGKPLGGWEEKIITKGVFVARPGIYFPLNPSKEELKDVRGRGVGKGVVLENWRKIIQSWEEHGLEQTAQIANVSRFCGAKSCITRSGEPNNYKYVRAYSSDNILPSYGDWITRGVDMGFHPMPKRAGINKDGLTLTLRELPAKTSVAYNKAIKSMEARMGEAAQNEILEQPDGDFVEFGDE